MKFTIILFIIVLPYTSSAQIQMAGRLVDQQQQPIAYASVILLHLDSTYHNGTTSSENGLFSLTTRKAGTFLLRLTLVGYETHWLKLHLNRDTVISTINLREQSSLLGEVVIEGERPAFEQHIDKLVINMANVVSTSGGSVLDVIERSPGLTVNRQSGSMSMNGKQGIQVMLDGKLQRLPLQMVIQQLEGIPTSSVEKLELITTPSSRFDAEGDAGIINIITKKQNQAGTHGIANVGIGYADIKSYFKNIASLNISHKRDNVTIYGLYSLNHDRRWQQWNYERQVYQPDLYSNTTTDRYVSWPIQRANVGVDWSLSKKTTLRSMVAGFSDVWKMTSFNRSSIRSNGSDSARIQLTDEELNHWKHLMGNVSVEHQFKSGIKFNADADYLYYDDENPNDFSNEYFVYETASIENEKIRTRKRTPIHMAVAKVDIQRTGEHFSWETGMKSTYSRLRNNVALENLQDGIWIPDPIFTQNYTLDDDVQAVYANLTWKPNATHHLQGGLRAESTDMVMSANEQKLFTLQFWKLFPSFFYTLKTKSNASWQFSYGKRITRPAYTSVAPFVIFMDPFTYYWGNLRLRPAISNNVQLSFLKNDFQFSFKYSHDKYAIAGNQSRYNASDQKTYIYADNVDLLRLVSLSGSVPFEITSWWKTQNNFLFTYQRTDHRLEQTELAYHQFSARLSTSHNFKLPNRFTFEITGIYVAPRRIGLSLLETVIDVSAGVQKQISDRSKISLTITDIFWTRNSVYITDNPLLGQYQKTSYYNEPQVLRLSYEMTFGNNKFKSSRRASASEAEQQRIN